MSIPRLPRAACLAALSALISCSGEPLVELRLYPCDVGGLPKSVRLELRGYDAAGAAAGEPLSASFTIPSAAVFADDYATVGYARPPQVVRADVTVAWFASASAGAIEDSEHVVFRAMVSIPTADAIVDIPAAGCAPWMGGTGTDSDTDSDTDTTTTANTTTTDPSTTDITTDATTTDTTTDVTTTTSTTDTTDATTTDATTTDSTTTDTTDTDTDTTTEGMEETPCDPQVDFQKCESEPGEAGTAYGCVMKGMGGVWQADPAICEASCMDDFIEQQLGLQQGVGVGCSGQSSDWACLCKEGAMPVPCTLDDQGCAGQNLHLCVDGELAKAGCANGCVDVDGPICAP